MRTVWVSFLLTAMVLAGCAEDAAPEADPEQEVFEDLDAQATEDTGIIRGVVIDAQIAPIAGATILIPSLEQETQTNEKGAFVFSDLAPGVYFLDVSAAGFQPAQTSVEVQAGVNDPPVHKVKLLADPTTLPFASPFVFESYMMCTESLVLVGYSGGCENDYITEYGRNDLGRIPDMAVSEMLWESTQTLGEWMTLVYSTPREGQTLLHNYAENEGPSPVMIRANASLMAANGLLTADSNPEEPGCTGTLCIRIFNAPMEGTDIGRDYGDPVDGDNCVERPALGGCTTGLGATIDQTVTVYTHAFYNWIPDEDWRFSEHGDPVPPS